VVPLTPFLWPALATAAASEMVSVLAKELAHLAAGQPSNSMFREPRWTTPNRIALELPSMRLREFSADGDDIATLVCAPLALHDARLTDFAPDHSLVAALRMAGLRNVFVTDWRSASPEMRFFSIDSYLADLCRGRAAPSGTTPGISVALRCGDVMGGLGCGGAQLLLAHSGLYFCSTRAWRNW
jgi:poly(3-hydroxybutyrate) depolymerase